ncbi:hemolysin family protein [Fodinibius salinus]|uniref:hemolysin family protein n=1 Tax=Fodinibius salinus TaxID=860790 RepID=UPI001FE7F879|nr:hemolysin family protein [Fodinibius salinus]
MAISSFSTIVFAVLTACMVLGISFSALFSSSEIAFLTLINHNELLSEGNSAQTSHRLLERMLKYPNRLLATLQIGNTTANIFSAILAAVLTGELIAVFALPAIPVYIIEVLVVVLVLLVLSEITPKLSAIENPLTTAQRNSLFIYPFFVICKPLAMILTTSRLNLEDRLSTTDSEMTTEELITMAEVSESAEPIKNEEREIIENVIEFGSTIAREIMTSRVDIAAIPTGSSLDEVLELIRGEGLSRMPIYEDNLDNILGVIHSKDVLPYINSDIERTTINWRNIARKALFVPATKKLDDLLRDFQQERTHIAIVVDEYGGTEGLVTLDDILEEIVGDISDEYDEGDDKLYTRFKSGVYIFEAAIDLDDMEEVLDCSLTSEDDEYETLGGLLYHLTERLPNVGERINYQNLECTIHSVENNRVKKVRVKVQDRPERSPEKD